MCKGKSKCTLCEKMARKKKRKVRRNRKRISGATAMPGGLIGEMGAIGLGNGFAHSLDAITDKIPFLPKEPKMKAIARGLLGYLGAKWGQDNGVPIARALGIGVASAAVGEVAADTFKNGFAPKQGKPSGKKIQLPVKKRTLRGIQDLMENVPVFEMYDAEVENDIIEGIDMEYEDAGEIIM